MKKYFIDEVNVIIDGEKSEVITIMGMGYDPNVVKSIAQKRAKEMFGGERFAAVGLTHRMIDLEEYKAISGSNPSWIIKEQFPS